MVMFTSAFMMGTAGGGLFVINTTSAENNINLRTKLDAANFNNDVESTIIYNLDAGVTVGSNTTATAPAWQTGTISSIHTLTLNISGVVYGMGGEGAPAGDVCVGTGSCPAPVNGGTGGDALFFARNGTVNVLATGIVKSGGGGGGKGGTGYYLASDDEDDACQDGNYGGRGQGFTTISAAVSGGPALYGDENSTGGAGGNGGAFGSTGQNGNIAPSYTSYCTPGSGGAAGYAVKKDGNTVTVNNSGVVTGTVG